MTWFVIVGSVMCVWAFLSVLGAERADQINVMKARLRDAAPPPANPVPPKPAPKLSMPPKPPPPPPPGKAAVPPPKVAGSAPAKNDAKSKR